MTQEKKMFYQRTVDDVMSQMKAHPTGLSDQEVKDRREQFGANRLTSKRRTTLIEKFISQFKDLMIIILIIAAIIAGFAGETVDAAIILAVVILNAVFGVFQESKAENAIDSLKEMSAPMATVLRNNQPMSIKSEDIVPGDIVLLEAGDVVPADVRLIEANSLKIEEAALTGESVPVNKQVDPIVEDDLPLGDRKDLGFMNSNVTSGRATGVVIGTGMNTEVGKIAHMLNTTEETTTPLQENLKSLGKMLTVLILVIAVIVFAVGMWRGQESLINMLLTAISLAVAAIPEGLPAIVTVTLALGTQQMARHRALIRKLPAVETLGSTDVIASDKTGTLTQNKMTVEKVFLNEKLQDSADTHLTLNDRLAQIMVLNNDTKYQENELAGDPTETALVSFYLHQDQPVQKFVNSHRRLAEIPFDSERKLMSTYNQMDDGQILMTMKGAPDQLLERVTKIQDGDNVRDITDDDKRLISVTNHDLATQALRVLAFAYRLVDTVPTELTSAAQEHDMIFVGLIGMIDPERPEVAQAVAEAKSAGIKSIMITGDHQDTAQAIAKRLGILGRGDNPGGKVINGAQLDEMSDDQFNREVADISVYARVAPEHKVRIVKAWQKQGKVVAMTGDGVNDAPALKTADIGVGMGITGTEVSKEASDMVLADDNFATIVTAVKAGRKVFANIQKSLQYLLSANLGEVLTLFVMTMMGWQILAPVQILWINLVTDTFPAIALGVEPAEPGIMKRKPRGRTSNFLSGGIMSNILYQGFFEGFITLCVYAFAITNPVHASDALAHADALTMAYATLGLIQLFHAFNSKTIHESIFRIGMFKNKFFNWALLGSAVLLIMTIVIPGFNEMFHVTELTASQWLVVVFGGFMIVVVSEVVKYIQRHISHK
ncbi:calcium-translocating P-type ATPase, PMCA-type [Lentilactobacillus buchneri]|uniref:P-type Ca(2+) transporter n=1 Tax=Lentilactobacillus buchneri subsp. silagei CD034 TaxID=1071400 RepID=J9W6J9_LENBU|nr:calcium-translocating P-type ATPase, PMCA-type [Lentilactobacillus buchneri]MCC6099963.1 calcium-translocating P-type ATPase, PMCA-type [Lactobacillus sp.]AFS00575.1 Ca2+-transporting ATPase [Lentilactobacillus buchneri subsp. silagei CD034]MCT2900046.1 calcium-translocating P-type ATPase, PMCA-type [Lentilactobacillus buchneri]MCT3542675.1 calcium-translocating P-type ATPase, PMCA-type [Lentilactobacillus buchneri]MCT3552381.1 calcium-translocating P-type ATPase, PMCA-type [Lentilactobacil